MDRVLFTIKPHSIIDVITNSSTELFVGETDNNIETFKEILKDYFDVYFKHNDNTYYEYDGTVESLCKVEEITSNNVEEWYQELVDWEIIPWYINTEGKLPSWRDFGYTDEEEANHKKALKEWEEKNSKNIKKELIGHVIVQGNGDNQIPDKLFELIESIFTTSNRIHQG